jgi:signal transduction histidine kinase
VIERALARSKLEPRGLAYDGLVALGLSAISLSILLSLTRADGAYLGTATALTMVHNLSLVGRRLWPVGVLGVQIATGLAVAALGLPPEVLGIGILVGIYSVAAQRRLRISMSALVVTELVVLAAQMISGAEPEAITNVGNAIVLAAAWLLGNSGFARRVYADELERRNEALQQARDELAHSVVAQERLRIARELHDVIGHSMSTIAVQSGVGVHVIDTNPDEAKRSLQTIEATSKAALIEIRRVLGLLRQSGEQAALDPSPGLEDIKRLTKQMSANSLEIDLQMPGGMPDLPPGAELTIYRIVQEALTNVVRHAGATRARVVLTHDNRDVRVEIVDDGGGRRASDRTGHGLVGMRERVDLFDGDFHAGPLPEGGFRVAARLPLEPRS